MKEKSFGRWQWRVIICTMIGYAMFYFVRKNFSFAIPLIQQAYPDITKAIPADDRSVSAGIFPYDAAMAEQDRINQKNGESRI